MASNWGNARNGEEERRKDGEGKNPKILQQQDCGQKRQNLEVSSVCRIFVFLIL